MEKIVFKMRHLLVLMTSMIFMNMSFAAVTVTPVTNGTCLPVSPGPFTTMSNIIITEGAVGDFAVQAGATLILTAPAGFEFSPGIGNASFTAGRDITSASLTVTASTITVTFTVGGTAFMDVLRIRNVRVRALATNITGNILRTGTGGTAVITGDAPGGGVNHGSLSAVGSGGVHTTISAGVWSNPAIWSTGMVPGCTDQVVINHAVTADVTAAIDNLTINAGGNLTSDQAVTVNGTFTMNPTAIYTHNNTSVAATTIFNGTESFDPTSKIVINRWSSTGTPIANGVGGDFGGIEVNIAGTWNQRGLLAPSKVKGTLTINNGLFILDNGTGMTTSLTLADVVVSGIGRIQVQTGTPRNLTLVTGSFTDNSASTGISSIAYLSVGTLNWTVNGDLTLSHRFSIQEGSVVTDAGSLTVNVNGDFTVNGGSFDGMRKVTGPMTMNVTGTTTITGTPGTVMFKDYYDGLLTFTSNDMVVNSNTNVYFQGTHSTTGQVNVTINNDLSISGNSTRLHLSSFASNANSVSLIVGNDLTVTNGQLYTSNSDGQVDVSVGRNYTQSGSTSEFYGQRNTVGSSATNVSVSGSINVTGGQFIQSRNLGTITLNVVENVNIQNSSFYGMNNLSVGNNGIASLTCTDLNISGSSFYLHRGYVTDGRTVNVDITGEMTVEFTNASQQVMFVGRGSDNNAQLDLQIGSNFVVFGSADGLFCSSIGAGNETIAIGGDMLVYAGRVRFNAYENFTARGHAVTGTVTGSLIMTGGSLCLSSNRGIATWSVGGDYDQSGGYAVYKWYNQGGATVSVQGNYVLSNSSVTFYGRTATATADAVNVTVNGNTTITNSTVVFDSCATSTAIHTLTLKGSSVTYNNNTIFDHLGHLSTRTNQASIIYDRAGVMNLVRNSSSYDIRHTRQTITAGTIVNFSSSPFDLLVSSHSSSASADHTTLTVSGELIMGTKMIVGREQTNYYAMVTVGNNAILRTAHTNGLYSGTTDPSCVYPLISGNYRMNYFLHENSRVVYNGTDNQILTGTGVGIATTTDHRYGFLEIDFTGTPDVEYVHLRGDSAQVKKGLILTNGELNLNENHNSNGVGHTLHLLNNATITRTNGYLRSETFDGSASLKWMINSTGSYVIPFGRSSTEYIPFTYQVTSGTTGNANFATNRVAVDNTPYPPTVTHVRDVFGADNSNQTVDRFWLLDVPGNVTSNLIFSATASEMSGVTSPRAQLWEPVSQGWFPPSVAQSNPSTSTTQINGVTGLNNWWTLSSSGSPLPVELLVFEAKAVAGSVKLNWSTATEINNDYFTVERSRDGSEFEEVVRVSGAGNSTNTIDYVAFDTNPYKGVSYYRLRQTDYDGTESYSAIRRVSFNSNTSVSVFPNPLVNDVVNIAASSSSEKVQQIKIYDINGKMMQQFSQGGSSESGSAAVLTLNKNLNPGTYMIEITTNEGVYRERVIKQ